MKLLDFTTVTPREIVPGYLGRYIHSDQITQGRVESARALTACVVLDVFHPPRDDYR